MKARILLLGLLMLPLACNKTAVDQPDNPNSGEKLDPTTYYANLFAFNNMKTYYLWADEVAKGLDSWKYGDNPVEKVLSLRYKDNAGIEDLWTSLMEDCSSFQSSVTGNGKTFGLDFVLYSAADNKVAMVILYTFAGSPAREAGLKRGDVILSLDGTTLDRSNYVSLLTEKLYDFPGTVKMGLRDGRNITMTAVNMYSDPVHEAKTLEVDGKKFGYLHFTNFTLEACIRLEEVFRRFKADGIEDLVLDLRYNTGGYATTATVLGSMIAPAGEVQNGSVFIKDVYNSLLGNKDTCFEEKFSIKFSEKDIRTVEALAVNPGIKRVWAITTKHSASASEMILCGLAPYMDVTLVGSTTYGKYCGGFLITAEDWYDALARQDSDVDCEAGRKATANWGIYVIASRYADCNGITLSMPSGIPADHEAEDDPLDGHELGDPSESMLSAVLSLAGVKKTAAPAVKSQRHIVELPFSKPGEGVLIY